MGGVVLMGLAGCETVEVVTDTFRDMTPHEAYLQGLHDAGLATTALSQDWIMESGRALSDPLPMTLPFAEEGYFTPEDPMAVGYRFAVERGQVVTISLVTDAVETGRVFFDLLRAADDPENPPRPVNADTTDIGFVYEPFRDGDFIIRIQPELLRGGAYELRVSLDPALAFPVFGRGPAAAQSRWGAPRDGGRRSHEGIDIFAPRGTPAIASLPGRVTRANVTAIGGKVVWLRDERHNRNIYYAHLDSQTVSAGQMVEIGDTLGFVGNTGNAITTPPHLHFGIYYRGEGAVDPYPFVQPVRTQIAELDVDRDAWGQWRRVTDAGIRLRAAPSSRAEVTREMERHAPVRVLGGSGDWYRVRLPDGEVGYLAARLTEAVDDAIGTEVLGQSAVVSALPEADAPMMVTLAAGTTASILGRFEGYGMVSTGPGLFGWIPDDQTRSTQDRSPDGA